jgi:uncharacterized protein
MRAVVDTNVLVSAVILPTSRTGAIIAHVTRGTVTPLYSTETLEEFARVLARPRIRDKYHIYMDDIRTILDLILLQGEHISPSEKVAFCRDPKDDIFLSVALAGKAARIVTGDNDLLVLHSFRGISIVSPGTFLAKIERLGQSNG